MTLSLFDQPRWRDTDPATSEEAARSVAPYTGDLVGLTRDVIRELGPMTQEQIATVVVGREPWRLRATVVSACARADLVPEGREKNPRGRWVTVWNIGLSS